MTTKQKLETGINQLKAMTRYARMAADAGAATEVPVGIVDAATRTVTFSFSSETACDNWYGSEILSHQAGAARMQRINAGGSLLFNHDMDDLLGVVEKAWIGADKRGYCTVRFGSDERGDWAMKQVDDRILQNVSFKYRIYSYETDVDSDIYTATDWEALEISLVTVPADASVGVGRSASDQTNDAVVTRPQLPPALAELSPASADNSEGTEMFKRTHRLMDAADKSTSTGSSAPAPIDHAALELARVTEIEAMCRSHQITDEVRNHLVTLKAPIEQARGIVLNTVLARGKGTASLGSDFNPDMTDKEKNKYSLTRAIAAAVGERMGDSGAWKDAGFEREVSQAIGKRSGKSTAGLFMPTNLRFYASRAADYSFGTGSGLSANSGGANMVATNLLAGSFIDMLRNKARVLSLGAQMLSGLVGNVDIPRQKAAGATYWVGEGAVLTQTGAQFDKVSLSPKHIGAISVITRNMLQQSTPDIEMMVRADMLATIALGVDAAALYGLGGGSVQPLGIANQSGIGSVIGGATGAALTIDHLIDLETFVASNNADEGSLAYLTNAKAVGALKKLKSSTGEYLWSNSPMGQRSGTPGEINGYTVARTNQARSDLTKSTASALSEVYFGDWSQVIVGEWGVLEILPNPYAAGIYEAGGVELRVLQSMDIAVRHPKSFAVMSDAITS